MIELFIKWLISQKILFNFLKASGFNISCLIFEEPEDYIPNSFLYVDTEEGIDFYVDTEEGIDFWIDIDKKWKEVIKEVKDVS